MTSVEQFIKDAIEGGWSNKAPIFLKEGKLYCKSEICADDTEIHTLLLDPKAWQAVGKTRGWTYTNKKWTICCPKHGVQPFSDISEVSIGCSVCYPNQGTWRKKWKMFVEHLANGKSIEESLTLIM